MSKATPPKYAIPSILINSVFLLHTHTHTKEEVEIYAKKICHRKYLQRSINLINLTEKQQKTKKMEDLWDKSKTPPQSATQLKTIIYGLKKGKDRLVDTCMQT